MLKLASFDEIIEVLDEALPRAAAAVDFALHDTEDLYRVASLLDSFAAKFEESGWTKEAGALGVVLQKIAADVDNFWQKPDPKKVKIEPWREGLGPLGHALSARHSPDLPGVSLMRVTDGVFEDSVSGKTYDFNKGFVLDDGTQYAGGSVSAQTPSAREKMKPLKQQINF